MTELRGSGQGQGQGMAAEGPSMGRATSGSLLRRLGLKKPKDRSVSLWLVTEHGCKSAAPAQCLYVSVYLCICADCSIVCFDSKTKITWAIGIQESGHCQMTKALPRLCVLKCKM